MASIQQALNQGLAQAMAVGTAGLYGYTQTEGFKSKQEAKHLYKEKSGLEEAGEAMSEKATEEFAAKLGKKPIDLTIKDMGDPGFYNTLSGRSLEGVNKRLADVSTRLYELEPDEFNKEQMIVWNKNYQAQLQDMAEQGAATRLDTKTLSARNMLEALTERRDLLSAKERGQLTTMLGRNKTKGGMDK